MTRALVCASLALAVALPGLAPDDIRITNASNTRLQTTPATDASTSAELPIGTELLVLSSTGGADPWYLVRTDDGREGWLFGVLTTPLDPNRRDQIIESLVEARLKAGGNFSANIQLVDLIERTAARLGDPDARGRFALYRLRSLAAAFDSIPFGVHDRAVERQRPEAEPYGAWIRSRLEVATYFESAGHWMVNPEYVKAVHSEYRDSRSGEDIAWFYVTNGGFGECEGDVPCYVRWQNEFNGWYLASYPNGRHADESVTDIARALDGVMDNFLVFPKVLAEFDPRSRCGELHGSLDPLTAAVTASTSTTKAEALIALDRFAQLCR
jgi:hypothetical protein